MESVRSQRFGPLRPPRLQFWFLCLTCALAIPACDTTSLEADGADLHTRYEERASLEADLVAEDPPQEGLEKSPPQCNADGLLRILGHRGISWNHEENPYPENTVLSVEAALAAGAVGAEVDIIKTADHVFVLAHEDKLHFVSSKGLPKTDCKGLITESNWPDIEGCQALSYMEAGLSSPLDRLETLLEKAGDATFILDVKNDQMDLEPWVTVYYMGLILEKHEAVDDAILMLYQPETVRFANASGLRACLKVHMDDGSTAEELAERVRATEGWGLCVYSKLLTEELVEALHVRNLEVSTYYLGATISDTSFDARLGDWIDWGVHSVITDRVPRGSFLVDLAACGLFP
jgi:glycerophosphoryl diester phosphodiesterase